jgi:hypothetical protein
MPGGIPTNFAVTLTYSNASGTINNAVFTNGVSVLPAGQGVTASLSATTTPISDGGGTGSLPLTISVTANAPAGSYGVAVWATNSGFTANSPLPGVATVTNILTVGAPVDTNVFTLGITPTSEMVTQGSATTFSAMVALTNLSDGLAETITNGVTILGPDTVNVTAGLSSMFASPPPGGGAAVLALSITNTSNALPGSYQVIVGATNSHFTGNRPIPGVAVVTNTLVIVAQTTTNSYTLPLIQSYGLSATTVTLAGTNGPANWQYQVLASTNLAAPVAQWTPVLSNTVNGSGAFIASVSLGNTPNPGAAQQFFRLWFLGPGAMVAASVFSPPAGPYYAETAVTITSATSGALIRYTTDGTTPSETNGTLYTVPVIMPQAVDTNLTGFLTNCSGVTMLKAIAYKDGMAGSPVFTGNYEILVPMKYPPTSSPVVGIAHVAYHVTSVNWADTLSFWTNYFGFAAVVISNSFALIKINDQQYVELYEGPLDSYQFQLANWGFQVTNAEAYREQLAAAGVSVPSNVTTNALGNLSFFTTDPDGHTNEWVQYLPASLTGLSQGQDMPDTQLFGYINGIGDCTTNEAAADNYYIGLCGFVTNQTHDVYIPNVNGYVEMLTANPGQVTAALAGKHEKIQLLNFQGLVLSQSLNILTNRDPTISITLSVEGTVGTKQQDAGDVYDADGSRVRLVDE